MEFVRDILKAKGAEVWTIPVTSSVYDALQIMADKDIGALMVNDGDKTVGIISERDYARKVALQGRSSRNTPIRDVMSAHVLSVEPGQTVEECMAVMTEKRVRHLPVCEGEEVCGIISIGDVVRSVIASKEFHIQQLEHYITGSGFKP